MTQVDQISTCPQELSDTLTQEQKEWYCRFKQLFSKDYESNIRFLQGCRCLSSTDWKKNLRHVLEKVLHSECEAYAEALRDIADSQAKGAKKLVWKSVILSRIPSVIGYHQTLRQLVIYDTDVHSLPSEMSLLVQLQTLVISKCHVYELPEWIGSMTGLVRLILSRCRLASLPESIASCTKLVAVDLKYNLLASLPRGMLSLPVLERLDVEGNPLQIDWTNESFPSLKNLNLSQTDVKQIPPDLTKRLLVLSWTGCKEIELPELGLEMRYLNLSGCTLKNFSIDVLPLLPRLEYINIPMHPAITDDANLLQSSHGEHTKAKMDSNPETCEEKVCCRPAKGMCDDFKPCPQPMQPAAFFVPPECIQETAMTQWTAMAKKRNDDGTTSFIFHAEYVPMDFVQQIWIAGGGSGITKMQIRMGGFLVRDLDMCSLPAVRPRCYRKLELLRSSDGQGICFPIVRMPLQKLTMLLVRDCEVIPSVVAHGGFFTSEFRTHLMEEIKDIGLGDAGMIRMSNFRPSEHCTVSMLSGIKGINHSKKEERSSFDMKTITAMFGIICALLMSDEQCKTSADCPSDKPEEETKPSEPSESSKEEDV